MLSRTRCLLSTCKDVVHGFERDAERAERHSGVVHVIHALYARVSPPCEQDTLPKEPGWMRAALRVVVSEEVTQWA